METESTRSTKELNTTGETDWKVQMIISHNNAINKNDEFWMFTLDALDDDIWIWCIHENKVFCSSQWKKSLGYHKNEIGDSFQEWKSLVHPDDLFGYYTNFKRHVNGEIPLFTCEHRMRNVDGSYRWFRDNGRVISRTKSGKPLLLVGSHIGIKKGNPVKNSMSDAQKMLKTALCHSYCVERSDRRKIYWLHSGDLRLFTNAAVSGNHLNSPLEFSRSFNNLDSHDPRSFVWDLIERNECEPDNEKPAFEHAFTSNRNTSTNTGNNNRIFDVDSSFIRSVDKTASSLTEHSYQIIHDRLQNEINKTQRANRPLAVLLIDVDDFNHIKGSFGPIVSERLLIKIEKRINRCVREYDPVVRYGEHEIAIIISGFNDCLCIDRVAQAIIDALANPFKFGSEIVYTSARIGISIYPNNSTEISELLNGAKQALYFSKHQGGNRFCYFSRSLQDALQTRMLLSNDLSKALPDQQFKLYYQPIVELVTGSIHKAEALIRWQHPVRGLLNPSEFMDIAEEIGMIDDISDWVFRTAANQVLRWHTAFHEKFQVSLNVSPLQLKNKSTANSGWIDYLREIKLPAESIVLEIVEKEFLKNDKIIFDRLLEFRNANIRLSLDDFGTGFLSLPYLKRFDINYIKIDQSFVCNLTQKTQDNAICEAIISMAHRLGMKVIAEGVETIDQCDILTAAGCDYGQGSLFSAPVPASNFGSVIGI